MALEEEAQLRDSTAGVLLQALLARWPPLGFEGGEGGRGEQWRPASYSVGWLSELNY